MWDMWVTWVTWAGREPAVREQVHGRENRPALAFCSWRWPSCLVRGAGGDLHFSASPSASRGSRLGTGPCSVARDPLHSAADVRAGPVPVGRSPAS